VRPRDPEVADSLNKADGYGNGKLEAEEALLAGVPQDSNCQLIFLRLPDVIGPYDGTLRLWAYWHWLRAGDAGAPPPQVQSYKRKKSGSSECPSEVDPDPPLALVFSRDVARFVASLLDRQPPRERRWDAVNLCCAQQVPLAEVLQTLSDVSELPRKRPRMTPVKSPKSYLPSVDRPWPLDIKRARDVYGFEPTSLRDALKSCADFFTEGVGRFPDQAKRAAKKLPQDSADVAIKCSGLDKFGDDSDSG
jgi:nucleoside-diphosphate-sugar epimerase